MKLYFLLLLVLLVGTFQPLAYSHAQEPPANPVLDILQWAGDSLPFPQWLVNIQTDEQNVDVSWTQCCEVSAIVTYQQQYSANFLDRTSREMSRLHDEEALNIIFGGYDQWVEIDRCSEDGLLLIELDATHNDIDYKARYWVWDRVGIHRSVTAVFGLNITDQLETLADETFPAIARCADGAVDPPSANIDQPPASPVLDMMLWAGDSFPYPDWLVTLESTATRVNVSWLPCCGLSAVAYYRQNYSPGYPQYTGQEISDFVNHEYLSVVFGNYDNWTEIERCLGEDILTVELHTSDKDTPYEARLWEWSEEGIYHHFFMVFDLNSTDQLEALADAQFGSAARCE